MEEEWKICDECDNYLISNQGKARRIDSNRTLKPTNVDGYLQVKLSKNGKVLSRKLHILVGRLFISNPENKKSINHINCNKSDNRIENLEWVTQKENIQHAWKNGLMNSKIGNNNSNTKIKEEEILAIKEMHSQGYSQRNIAKKFAVCQATICFILNNKRYSSRENIL